MCQQTNLMETLKQLISPIDWLTLAGFCLKLFIHHRPLSIHCLICPWSDIWTHLFCKSGFHFPSLYSFKQVLLHYSFIPWFPTSVHTLLNVECCSDKALVLAVKWSICRYVCLHHRHLLTHSLLCSPDEQKRLISTGFKDTAFSPIWLRFPGGCVFPFESQPNRLWWHLCVLHESILFSCENKLPTII